MGVLARVTGNVTKLLQSIRQTEQSNITVAHLGLCAASCYAASESPHHKVYAVRVAADVGRVGGAVVHVLSVQQHHRPSPRSGSLTTHATISGASLWGFACYGVQGMYEAGPAENCTAREAKRNIVDWNHRTMYHILLRSQHQTVRLDRIR
jgi:hypothetical protein